METNKTQFHVFLVLLLALCLNTEAQEGSLPSAESIMDKYVEVTGGFEAYDKISSRCTKSELNVWGTIIKVVKYQKKPNLAYELMEVPFMGKIENGTDGNTVWAISKKTGVLIQEGKDRDQFLSDTWFDQFVYWRNSFISVKYIGIVKVNDLDCYEIEAFPANLGATKIFYQINTGLILKTEMPFNSAFKEIKVESFLSDYRNIDSVLIPFETKVLISGRPERISRVVDVKNNIPVSEETFLPGIVKELILKNK
jgi:hypothetical protein